MENFQSNRNTLEQNKPCPIDGSKDFSFVYNVGFKKWTFALMRCKLCGLEMVNPQPPVNFMSQFYDANYYGKESVKFLPIIQWLRRISVLKKVHKILSLYKSDVGSIMDIGCADGTFLFNIKKRHWNTTGLEISDYILSSPHLKDLNIVIGDIVSQRFPERSYNIVTLWHVFEHLPDPDLYLFEIHRIMTRDGLLVITVPNIDSWQARWFGQDWFHRDIPRHLYHYSPMTLGKLLDKYGFSIEMVEHFSLEYNPFGYIQSFFNKFYADRNRFYNRLKNINYQSSAFNRDQTGLIRFVLCLLFLPFIIFPAIILSIAEALAKKGGTIKVYARHQ